jgi:hypothetical protein
LISLLSKEPACLSDQNSASVAMASVPQVPYVSRQIVLGWTMVQDDVLTMVRESNLHKDRDGSAPTVKYEFGFVTGDVVVTWSSNASKASSIFHSQEVADDMTRRLQADGTIPSSARKIYSVVKLDGNDASYRASWEHPVLPPSGPAIPAP